MKRRFLLAALVGTMLLVAATESAQAQFRGGRSRGFSIDTPIGSYGQYNSPWSGRSTFVDTPFFSYGRGYSPFYSGYGGYYGSPYGSWNNGYYPYRSGLSFGLGSSYYGPGYGSIYSSPSYSGYSVPGYAAGSLMPSYSSSYALDSRSGGYQSFYPSSIASDSQAVIQVTVPNPDATVYFEDTPTTQKGTQRVFVSPSLEKGRSYTYTVKATWNEGGREMTRTKDVRVQAGAQVACNFDLAGSRDEHHGSIDNAPRTAERRDEFRSGAAAAPSGPSHTGTLVRTGNNEFVMGDGDNQHTHRLAPDAQIMVDGRKANLEDLKSGMRITVWTKEGDKTVATRVEAKSAAAGDREERRSNELPPE